MARITRALPTIAVVGLLCVLVGVLWGQSRGRSDLPQESMPVALDVESSIDAAVEGLRAAADAVDRGDPTECQRAFRRAVPRVEAIRHVRHVDPILRAQSELVRAWWTRDGLRPEGSATEARRLLDAFEAGRLGR